MMMMMMMLEIIRMYITYLFIYQQSHLNSLHQADMSELRTVAAELANRSTRHELNQSVNNHVKPLVGNESDDDDYEDDNDDYDEDDDDK